MKKFSAVLVVLFLAFAPESIFAQVVKVPEIPDPSVGDIAQVRMTPSGPVIFYNPIVCANMGVLACRFFRAHEYGHVVNGDALGYTFPPLAEMRADCWATWNAHPAEVQAGIQFFLNLGYGGDPVAHGNGFQRARRVSDALQFKHCHW